MDAVEPAGEQQETEREERGEHNADRGVRADPWQPAQRLDGPRREEPRDHCADQQRDRREAPGEQNREHDPREGDVRERVDEQALACRR